MLKISGCQRCGVWAVPREQHGCSEHLLLPWAELGTGHTAGCGGCVYGLEAQREEPRGVFISTAKAEQENVQNSAPNLH